MKACPVCEGRGEMDAGRAAQIATELASVIETLRADFTDEIDRFRNALTSIASNTCCDKCQEAALVAKAALDSARFAPTPDARVIVEDIQFVSRFRGLK